MGLPSLWRLPEGPRAALERKDAALFALLALDGPTAREVVAGLLWPGATPPGAHNNLRQRIFRLRRRFGAEVILAGVTLQLPATMRADVLHPAEAAEGGWPFDGELLGSYAYDDCERLALWVRRQRELWRARRTGLRPDSAPLRSDGVATDPVAQSLSLPEGQRLPGRPDGDGEVRSPASALRPAAAERAPPVPGAEHAPTPAGPDRERQPRDGGPGQPAGNDDPAPRPPGRDDG